MSRRGASRGGFKKRQQSCRTPRELAQLGGLVADDLEGALEVVRDEGKFLGGIASGELQGGGGYAFVEMADALEGFRAGTDEDFAAVTGVAEAFDEARFFEAVEDAGDGASGEAGGAGEVASGEGLALGITGHHLEASGISNVETHFRGDGLMEKDGDGAELAAEVHADSLDEISPFARVSGGQREFFHGRRILS